MKEYEKHRLEKLQKIEEKGIEPYPKRFNKGFDVEDILEEFEEGKGFSTAGRIMTMRNHGKSIFADIKDATGKIQIYIKKDTVGDERFSFFNDLIETGDILGVSGTLFRTRTNEPTINVSEFQLLSKGLKDLPEKWHGLKDIEIRYRQRYVDLIVNDDVKNIFVKRSLIINQTRDFLTSRSFLEVETPMMQPLAGGAAGEPFVTHHNSLDMDLFLRLAPELYLKKLLVGGFERVYELNRAFRNEGLSTRHNPEFTILEAYAAYWDYEDMMNLTEELISTLAETILGSKEIEFKERKINLSPPWKRVSFADVMKRRFGIEPADTPQVWEEKLKDAGKKAAGGRIARSQVVKLLEESFELEDNTSPTFVIDYFTSLCPLAKAKRDEPAIAERFELFIGGLEVANAYSELNDPIEQRKRFQEQGSVDEDFISALEYGMPPAAGLGIGIDRLVMLFCGQDSIRDVILFPQLRA